MRTVLRITLVLFVLLACAPAAAVAVSSDELVTLASCEQGVPSADGSRRQKFTLSEDGGGLAGIPPRVNVDVELAREQQICIGFQNQTSKPFSMGLQVSDVGVDEAGRPSSQAEEAEYGAAQWVRLPAASVRDLQPGEVAWLVLDVDVPADAAPGSWYASVTAQQEVDPSSLPGPESGPRVVPIPSVAVQLFFDVPGDGARGGSISTVRAPRVVWWDGLNIDTVPVLDRVRGLGIAPVRFTWRNGGSYTDTVSGTLIISSTLSGKVVERVEIPERVVLRGTERELAATWQRNIPMLGRFDAVIEMRTSDGSTVKRKLEPIWVIPAWWYFVVLAAALALPIGLRRRSKRRYSDLVARVEAAELRAADAVPEDDPWNDAWGGEDADSDE